MPSVSVEVDPLLALGDYLQSLGWIIGDYGRLKKSSPFCLSIPNPAVSLLVNDHNRKPKKTWWGKVYQPRLDVVGCIWLDDAFRKANTSNWVFEVYGKSYMPSSEKLAKDLCERFNVNITVKLICNHPKLEFLCGDLSSWTIC